MKIFIIALLLVATHLAVSIASETIEIECHFSMSSFGKKKKIYQCDTKNLNVEAHSVVENISGRHLEGKKHVDVERLQIAHQVCHFMPSGFDIFFPNLRSLRIVSSGLKQINLSDLKPFPLLMFIEVYANDVSTLQTDIFSGTPRLTSIRFEDNKIEKVGRDLLEQLKALRKAQFRGNICISQSADSNDKIGALQRELNEKC